MLKKEKLSLLLILFFFSCVKPKKDYKALFDLTKAEKISYTGLENYLVDSSTFYQPDIIYLETTESSLINLVDKLQVDSNDLYILDKKAAKILHFDIKGKYINQLHSIGKGPTEYGGIVDFLIDKVEKEIFVLCDIPYSIYVYDFDLKFKRAIKTDDLYLEMVLANDEIICRKAPLHNNELKDSFVDVLDRKTGKIKESLLPIVSDGDIEYKDIIYNKGTLLYTDYTGRPLISIPDRNFVYGLNGDYKEKVKYTLKELQKENRKGIYNFKETKNYIFFQNNNLLSVIDKKKKTLTGFEYGIFNVKTTNATINRLVPSNLQEGIVQVSYPENIKKLQESIKDPKQNKMFMKFAEHIDVEQNPILFLYVSK
ncbi:6-bladed beta-propeller [Sphingobacterium sp. 18053]|uniref:6-bladed beta-propeller n=1 Tax=Sphingobacterium sp. 18053 TaxID=2681401 RepID=UPI00135A06EA|nr:6-bladed beta-propeller [Sphingobacterium sp. 18053]